MSQLMDIAVHWSHWLCVPASLFHIRLLLVRFAHRRSSDGFTVIKLKISCLHIMSGVAFVRSHVIAPEGQWQNDIRWGMPCAIWTKLSNKLRWGRFCDHLLHAVGRRCCQLISRLLALILWGKVSFPLTLSLWGSNLFSKTSNHSDIANATDTKGRRFRHPAQSDG